MISPIHQVSLYTSPVSPRFGEGENPLPQYSREQFQQMFQQMEKNRGCWGKVKDFWMACEIKLSRWRGRPSKYAQEAPPGSEKVHIDLDEFPPPGNS